MLILNKFNFVTVWSKIFIICISIWLKRHFLDFGPCIHCIKDTLTKDCIFRRHICICLFRETNGKWSLKSAQTTFFSEKPNVSIICHIFYVAYRPHIKFPVCILDRIQSRRWNIYRKVVNRIRDSIWNLTFLTGL